MTRKMRTVLRALLAAVVVAWASPAAAQEIDLNSASASELEQLPGLGPATAARIIEWREQNGPFQSLEDLQQVKGISAATVEKLRGHATVGGGSTGGTERVSGVKLVPSAASGDQVKALLDRYKNEPSVREVQEAASRFAEVHPELMSSWRSRARIAALGPNMRGEYRYVGDFDRRIKTGGDAADTLQDDFGTSHRPLGRVDWDLDRLIFNPDELRVSNEIVDLVRLRESVLDQVTKIYYERRRLQLDLDLTPPKDLAGRVRKELRLQELVADLDSLTGGYFSKKLIERGLDPY